MKKEQGRWRGEEKGGWMMEGVIGRKKRERSEEVEEKERKWCVHHGRRRFPAARCSIRPSELSKQIVFPAVQPGIYLISLSTLVEAMTQNKKYRLVNAPTFS